MRHVARTVAVLLVVLAAVRIASTWRIYSETADEGIHVGAGLELLQFHTYTLHPLNPPPPRVVWSIAPYLSGMRFVPAGNTYDEQTHSVFYGHGDYVDNLARARAGNLPFFIIAAIAIWLIARDRFGEWGAVVAILLFTMEPIVLGYSGLVTHDTPAMAGVAVALLAFECWLRKPDVLRAIVFGAAFGFAILCKFSCLAFVPLVCGAVWLFDRKSLRTMLPAIPATLLTVWAGYGFNIYAFIDGVREILETDMGGFNAYAMGRFTMSGWWWYFPLAIAIKTTLPLLALFILGAFDREHRRTYAQYAIATLAILAITLHSSLDIGVRYLLPLYVPLVLAATTAVMGRMRKLAIVLVATQIAVSAFAHPDYFPYFNAIAGRDPSWFLIDSNLDWGQDVLRLRETLRKEHVDEIGLALFGPADYDALHFPPHHVVNPWTPAHGWIAVSDFSYRMTLTKNGGWLWLQQKPYRRVGKSIRLYHLP
jgi:4-amino-4-deoxy-L-arabinose transferase-like glycosyltransferase